MGNTGVTKNVRFPLLGGSYKGVHFIIIPNLYICSVPFIIKVEKKNGHQD